MAEPVKLLCGTQVLIPAAPQQVGPKHGVPSTHRQMLPPSYSEAAVQTRTHLLLRSCLVLLRSPGPHRTMICTGTPWPSTPPAEPQPLTAPATAGGRGRRVDRRVEACAHTNTPFYHHFLNFFFNKFKNNSTFSLSPQKQLKPTKRSMARGRRALGVVVLFILHVWRRRTWGHRRRGGQRQSRGEGQERGGRAVGGAEGT